MKFLKLTIALIIISITYVLSQGMLTIENAKSVVADMKIYCSKNGGYPTQGDLKQIVKKHVRKGRNNWYLHTNRQLSNGTLQYPMSFWHPMAIGEPKLSEILSIPYAYTVVKPCSKKARF